MATFSDKQLALARVYSASILELAERQGEADSLLEELGELVACLDRHAELDTFFSSPMIDPKKREQTIERLFRTRASDLLVDSVQILNAKGRLDLLRCVVETYRSDHEELRGLVKVYVRTAVPLTDALRHKLSEAAGRFTGRKAKLVETVDDSIIGGVIVRVGDRKIDASVVSRLNRLGRVLADRASREVHSATKYVA